METISPLRKAVKSEKIKEFGWIPKMEQVSGIGGVGFLDPHSDIGFLIKESHEKEIIFKRRNEISINPFCPLP